MPIAERLFDIHLRPVNPSTDAAGNPYHDKGGRFTFSPAGKPGKAGGNTRSGMTMSEMGRVGETLLTRHQREAGVDEVFGEIHETVKTAQGQNPIDLASDSHAIELKTIDSTRPRLNLRITADAVASKTAAAESLGLEGAVVAQIYDVDAGVMHVFAHRGGFSAEGTTGLRSRAEEGGSSFELTGVRTGEPVAMERIGSYTVDSGEVAEILAGPRAADLWGVWWRMAQPKVGDETAEGTVEPGDTVIEFERADGGWRASITDIPFAEPQRAEVWVDPFGFLAGRGGNPYHDERGRFTHGPGGPKAPSEASAGEAVPEDRAMEMQNGSAADHLVQDENGDWHFTEERQALHDEIIARELEGKHGVEDPRYNMMGGGPASGKSAILRSEAGEAFGEDDTTVVVNADDMKQALPEYGPMHARGDKTTAAFTHAESSYLAARLQNEAIRRRVNVTLDSTGDSSPDKLRGKIQKARDAGYTVHGAYVTVPTEMAVERAVARATNPGPDQGRWIPEGYLRATHATVSNTAMQTYQSFDSWDLYDTRSGVEHVMSWDGETTTVHNQGLFDEFIAKGVQG